MMSVRQVGWAQRGGIDRVILLKSGKTITVDEKVRSKEYDDILLERWSDEKKQKPGWIQKDLACDFIAYAFIQSQRCFLFPFLQLRKCWIDNGRAWVRDYKEIRAENNGYTTVSVGVPINILTAALREAMEVKW